MDYLIAIVAVNACTLFVSFFTAVILPEWLGDLVRIPWALLAFYASVCNSIKRMADLGRSPWFLLLIFVPPVTLVLLIYLFFFPGQQASESSSQIVA